MDRLALRAVMPHMPLYRLEAEQAARMTAWSAACGLLPDAAPGRREPLAGGSAAEHAPEQERPPERESAEAAPQRPPEAPAAVAQPPALAPAAPPPAPELEQPRVRVEALIGAADPEALADGMERAAESGEALVPLGRSK